MAQLWNVPVAVGHRAARDRARARARRRSGGGSRRRGAGFVALSPVFTRTASMINPEPTDLLVSVLCLYLAARIFTGAPLRGCAPRSASGSRSASARWCGSSHCGRSRSSCSRSAPRSGRERRAARAARTLAIALAAVRRRRRPVVRLSRGELLERDLRPAARRQAVVGAAAGELLPRPGLPDVFSKPYRQHMANLAWPQTYTDIWGDWYGVFAWRRASAEVPAPATNGWLVAQNASALSRPRSRSSRGSCCSSRSLRRRDAPWLLVSLAAARRDRGLPASR